uniref:Uncharacterized protein n=1 Tax=Magnetospirillum gryphiswaldense TaxID=55518 RepID=Q3BKG5_9PROT|nr:hypothetical protein mgI410 [Magnetospirillum gryphiswaldense MSR-1]CAM77966.1 hypothetical protein MGR_4034 [Magnetospirillum gryphiswaldense MSR-1]
MILGLFVISSIAVTVAFYVKGPLPWTCGKTKRCAMYKRPICPVANGKWKVRKSNDCPYFTQQLVMVPADKP